MGLIQGYKVKGADLQGQIEGFLSKTSVGWFLCSSTIVVHFVCFLRQKPQLVRISGAGAA